MSYKVKQKTGVNTFKELGNLVSDEQIRRWDNTSGGSGTLYGSTGQNTDGPMTQKATTDELNKKIEYTEGMTAPVIDVLSDYYNKSQSDSRYYTKTESATEMKTIVDSEIAKVKTSYDTQITQINTNKANTNLDNINPAVTSSLVTINGLSGTKRIGARICTESWISDDSSQWYRLYNDGWKEVGGYSTIGETTTKTITLPISFSNIYYTVLVSNASGKTTANAEGVITGKPSTVSAVLFSSGYIDPNTSAFHWEAKGY